MDDIRRFECEDGFAVESKDEDEVVKIAKMHIKEKDNQEVEDNYVRSALKMV